MVESGQLAKPLHSNSTTRTFKLQPAPCRRNLKTSARPPANAPDSPVDPSFARQPVLRSVFEDEEEEQDVLTPKPVLDDQRRFSMLSPTTLTPAAIDQAFVHKISSSFPRQTLMRSLSSSCVLSPTSPERKSTLLRKRLGWRGQKAQHEFAIPISPGSPLSPNRARQLHTPTTADSLHSITFTMLNDSPTPDAAKEPLSATLKALGAKRHSIVVPSEASSATSFTDDTGEVLTATRKTFFLPTWAKLRNTEQKRAVLLEENREAAKGFHTLLLPRDFKESTTHKPGEKNEEVSVVVHEPVVLPRICQAGGRVPLSPNGHLFSGFDEVSVNVTTFAPSAATMADQVRIVHRPPIATLRSNRSNVHASDKVSGIVSALCGPTVSGFGQRGGGSSDERTGSPSLPHHPDTDDRRDGWGGVLTRLSWFADHAPGPLLSPRRNSGKTRLKSLYLVPVQATEEWEDVTEVATPTSAALDAIAPRFRFAQTDKQVPRSFWPFQPRPTAVLADEKSTALASQLVVHPQSVENRLVTGQTLSWVQYLLVLLVLALLASCIANIVLTTKHKTPPAH